MRRRSKAGGEPVKTRRRETLKRRNTAKAVVRRSSSTVSPETTVALLSRERDEALEQLSAASEVLKVISSSPGDLKPVFEAILENATRICDAKFGTLWLRQGDGVRAVALHGAPAAWADKFGSLYRPGPNAPMTRVLDRREIVHVPDLRATPAYVGGDPIVVDTADLAGVRTLLAVPMLRGDELIGVIAIYRKEVLPFPDKHIELVRNFAAQAVIAIENTRLLSELRQSLEQQTATADVLRVISSSPGDLEPVFQAMLENATRICGANFGNMFLYEHDAYRTVAMHNAPQAYANARTRTPLHPSPATALGRVAVSKEVVQIADLKAEKAYIDRDPMYVSGVELAGIRTLLAVPMLKDGGLIGAIVIYRTEVRPFTDKQTALVQNFAAQAVIAIENTRLLNELRELLQQQTATADVLKVISRSTFDLQVVLDTLTESASILCAADMGAITREDGSGFRHVTNYKFPPDWIEFNKTVHMQRGRGSVVGRSLMEGKVVQVPDVLNDPEYTYRAVALKGGYRTFLAAPMIREDKSVGVLVLGRKAVAPFSDKQIELVSTFADQAAIAIENVRLFNAEQQCTRELAEALRQQTATADVLKVISRSTFDLQTVLDTLVESAARLCDADHAWLFRRDGDSYRWSASYGHSRDEHARIKNYFMTHNISLTRTSLLGRTALAGKPTHIVDVLADPDYKLAEVQKLGNYRTAFGVPLLREGETIGVIGLLRNEVRPFTDKQIELVTTFADQAVIAIENVRLFDEIQDKSRQLAEASQHKSQFLANMSHELRTPLNAILGYTELMADGAYGEPSEKMLGVLKRLESNGRHLLGLINDVLDLSKIEAGQLVLELSDYSVQDIAQTVRSTLEPLAADKKLAFKVEVAAKLPPGFGDGRRLTQVLINLVGNAIKFTDTGEVVISAAAADGSFHLSVRDTGPGISAADQAKLFQEFQQADNTVTRKKGGTGLGLAISKRIVEMHGGRIWIDSVVGRGSTFSFTVPVRVERQMETA